MQNFFQKKKMGKNMINIALFGLGRIGQLHAKASFTMIGPVSEIEVTRSKSDAFNNKLICSFL